jgi:tryptophanyl-tRNA synthetase
VQAQHEFFGKDQGLRIKDLADPTKKMSKSDESGKGVVFMTDSAEEARKKVMSATTDSVGKVQYADDQPGIANLLDILKLLGGNPEDFIDQDQYGPLKEAVANVVVDFLNDFQAKLSQVNEADLLAKLQESERQMNEQANQALLKVQRAVGLRPQ